MAALLPFGMMMALCPEMTIGELVTILPGTTPFHLLGDDLMRG